MRHILLAMVIPLFYIFILYIIKVLEIGMNWDFTWLGIYPMEKKGLFGIISSPLIHASFSHLLANTLPLFFLSWCLFYFYRNISLYIFFIIWIGCGVLTFLIGKPGWHIGASGIVYGLAFFLFFSGLLRKHIPLIAISLLVTFLYGGLIWNMIPFFTPKSISWEGHLSGAIVGMLSAAIFVKYGPQKPNPFAEEDNEDNEENEDDTTALPEHEEKEENEENEINKRNRGNEENEGSNSLKESNLPFKDQ